LNTKTLELNKKSWDEAAPRFFGRTALPEYGPFSPTEDELNLFGKVEGLKVLEVGCGSGHSLKYMSERNAAEIWGLDLSSTQIETAKLLLKDKTFNLFESAMENDPGLPKNYFDIVYSIFALGWTTDINMTLSNIYHYLKPGGTFVFSWEHPIFSRVKNSDQDLLFAKPYHEEGTYKHEAWNLPAFMQQYKVSTYINTLTSLGFTIEKMIEDVRFTEELKTRHENRWYNEKKVAYLPTTIIFKCVK
jgi:ubiquinone/menaquinone biosynthesis C-methylase UbiE